MTAPDYFTVEWSPTRGQAIVRSTCDEIPWAECDEAAHQLLAAGNMARRINGPIARGGFAGDEVCVACKHVKAAHLPQDGACVRTTANGDCPCAAFEPPLCKVCGDPESEHSDGRGHHVASADG